MKEFILKHPIITLLIVEEICNTVKTCINKRYYYSSLDELNELGGTAIRTVKEHIDQEKETVVTGFHPGN